jgi:hypothetical protein
MMMTTRVQVRTQGARAARVSIAAVCALLLVGSACGDVSLGGDEDQGVLPGGLRLPSPSGFSCDDLDGSEEACLDWNDARQPGLEIEGGRWEVRNGMAVGFGPDAVPGDCTDSLMSHAMVPDVEAQDVLVRARLASLQRVDKVLVLRSADPANRVQVNFRAREGADYGDLIVQEIRDCAFTKHTADNEIPIPHGFGDAIDVEVELVGAVVRVRVDGAVVFDREVPIAVRAGKAGFGVIDRSVTVFDDFVMVSYD